MAVFTWGYTGSMMEQLAPWYDFVPFDGNLWDCEKGGILLRVTEGNPCAHTCIVSVAGSMVLEASDDFDGMPGDSSGYEVAEIPIHQNGWEWFGIPKDNLNIDAGIEWGRMYASDDSHGYSQGTDRFGLQCDCSSFVLMIVSAMIEAYNGENVNPAPQNPDGTSGWEDQQANAPQWQGVVVGKQDTTGAGDDYAGVPGKPILMIAADVGKYQVHVKGGNWLETVTNYNIDDLEYGCAGDMKPIDALRIYDSDVWYQTHDMGGEWNEPIKGLKDSSPYNDDFAGTLGIAQDLVRIWRDSGEQPRYNVYS